MTTYPKPLINVPHRVEPGTTIKLYPVIPVPFIKLMAGLYPLLSSYDKSTSRGYSAFTADGQFIGTMASTGLTSIRKNPLFDDGGQQLYMRALLGGLHINGHNSSSMVCEHDNYGTLRLIQKLGMGARLDARGSPRSALATPETLAFLRDAIDKAKGPYAAHREYAARQLASIPPGALDKLIPTEKSIGCEPRACLDVTLL